MNHVEIKTWEDFDEERNLRRKRLIDMQRRVDKGFENLMNWEYEISDKLWKIVGERKSVPKL